mmetsp:Transcript_10257/g.62734  ORF Transcript_10257/g.62734 Transcript_10257/m.62734 type:complete len:81 (-) Transcript_10257:1759-2001(-)
MKERKVFWLWWMHIPCQRDLLPRLESHTESQWASMAFTSRRRSLTCRRTREVDQPLESPKRLPEVWGTLCVYKELGVQPS